MIFTSYIKAVYVAVIDYTSLLETGSLDNAIHEFSLA